MEKVLEMKQEMNELKAEVRSLNEAGNVEDAEKKLAEVRALKKRIEIQEELDNEEEREVEEKMEKRNVETKKQGKLEERDVFAKAVKGQALTAEERALLNEDTGADGGYIVPQSISTQIEELKRQYKRAKNLVEVIPTSTNGGSWVMEDLSSMAELVNFDDSTTGLAEQQPTFKDITYAIKNYGAIFPISNTLLQDEAANLLSYLNRNFAKRAIKTENSKIFAALKLNKTATAVDVTSDANTVKSLKKLVNVELDPAIKAVSVWAMNQSAFNYIDEMVDSTGRPLLQPNPTQPTDKMLFGLPVNVFSDNDLPAVSGNINPMFVGSLYDGCKYFDRHEYNVQLSKDAGFEQNQTKARVIERFDVVQGDSSAYVYATIDTTNA